MLRIMQNIVWQFQRFSMLIICLLQILIAPAWACSCSKISSVKANMHTLQTVVETYFLDHGYYPKNVVIATFDAKSKSYWKDFRNPFMAKTGLYYSYDDKYDFVARKAYSGSDCENILGICVSFAESAKFYQGFAGMALYEYLSPKQYVIYGTDKVGNYIQDKGIDFVLVPS